MRQRIACGAVSTIDALIHVAIKRSEQLMAQLDMRWRRRREQIVSAADNLQCGMRSRMQRANGSAQKRNNKILPRRLATPVPHANCRRN